MSDQRSDEGAAGRVRVEETRNSTREAIHEIVVYSASRGWLTEATWEDPLPLRSTAKPLLLSLSLDSVGLSTDCFTSAELAVMSSSHNGEARHRRLLMSLLSAAGLAPSDLQLGSHERIVPEPGLSASTETPLCHNCSGKHVSSLLVLQHEDFAGHYLDPTRPLFDFIRRRLAEIVGHDVPLAVDGCGYPTPCLTPMELAQLYARPDEVSSQLRVILRAMLEVPWAVAGARRLTSELLSRGIWAKEGFTGLFVLTAPTNADDVLVAKALSGSDTAVETGIHGLVRAADPSFPLRSTASIYPDEIIRNDAGMAVGLQSVAVHVAGFGPIPATSGRGS